MPSSANGPGPMAFSKYRSFDSWYAVPFDDKWKERKWPSQRITKAPRWCSVDLRDGNQALINPMNHDKKLRFFQHLLKLGYKEIEVGFPAASQIDFDFCRFIVEHNLVPDDVYIQVLCQCREDLITRTVQSLVGAKKVILHIYNSTSELQRRVVYQKDREGIKGIALQGAELIKKHADEYLVPQGTEVMYEYSPESFTGTEVDFALDVCEAVAAVLAPKPQDKIIINLPATVEMSSPNIYADQIEWMSTHFKHREKIILSLHPHNDRGTGVACAELGIMAGADRVEGCLFGNGERTGNVCIVTLAMNLFSQGIDPEVDYRNIQESIDIAEYCNELKVPERWPWAGSLVYTAFSGSHQDAIKKGMVHMKGGYDKWEVPYLPIDPEHIGRSYEAVVRVNSQSGKGGIAYILEQDYGIPLPTQAQFEFSKVVQEICDKTSAEITPAKIFETFKSNYLDQERGYRLVDLEISTTPVALQELQSRGIMQMPKPMVADLVEKCKPLKDRRDCYQTFRSHFVDVKLPIECFEYELTGTSEVTFTGEIGIDGDRKSITGRGNGPIDAFVQGLNVILGGKLKLHSYSQHDLEQGAQAESICYVSMSYGNGPETFGAGLHPNTTRAAIMAVTAASNRAWAHVGGSSGTEALPIESICSVKAIISFQGQKREVLGSGNGPVAALIAGLRTFYPEAAQLSLMDYSQTARGSSKDGAQSEAVCAIACQVAKDERSCYGIGIDTNTNLASAKAVLSSLSLLSRSSSVTPASRL